MTHIVAGFEVNFQEKPLVCVGVKHGNACGAAVGSDAITVMKGIIDGDPDAIFGGYVMTNFPITEELADTLRKYHVPSGRRPIDGIIAPSISGEAIESLTRKDKRCRMIVNKALGGLTCDSLWRAKLFRHVREGFLLQSPYDFILDLADDRIEKYGDLSLERQRDMVLAWGVGSTSQSNKITLARGGRVLANAVAQQSRVGAARLANLKCELANNPPQDCVAYSDSFFPFPDGIQVLNQMGVEAVLTSIGGNRYHEVREYCIGEQLVFYAGPDEMMRGFFGH